MAKRKNNVEIITEIMDFSRAGPMAQMFIVESIRKYAGQVADSADELIEQMKDGFVSGEAWVHTAKIVVAELDAAYDANDEPGLPIDQTVLIERYEANEERK